MAAKKVFYFDSCDGIHKIHSVLWGPENIPVTGIVQIAHGMTEHIERYELFAEFMCDYGFVVAGNNHLGHGDSVNTEDEWGFFAGKDGFQCLVKDMYTLKTIVSKKYPKVPYFLLGHSMGSFLSRIFITKYGSELNGVIIMGTANQSKNVVRLGKLLAGGIAWFKGWNYRSKLIYSMTTEGYIKSFEPSKTPYDWLTKDENIVREYNDDKRCTFIFTLSAYRDMFDGLIEIADLQNIMKIPKTLPIFLVAGEKDPVGNFGKGVVQVFNMYKNAGIKDLSIKLYVDDRHEILNETDKATVYEDLLTWIKQRCE